MKPLPILNVEEGRLEETNPWILLLVPADSRKPYLLGKDAGYTVTGAKRPTQDSEGMEDGRHIESI